MAIKEGSVENMVIASGFWQGKKVFVTGHTGFKGSWLLLWLQQLGAQVTGYSRPPLTQPNLFEVANIAEGIDSIFGDICDQNAINKAILECQPDIVIHMAAQALVRFSYQNPVETYQTNVMGTLHVLEAIKACDSVKSVVIVTTDKCYENKEWIWAYRENDPLGGHDPYSSSKACVELLVSSYRNSFLSNKQTLSIATARAGNVIAGGDWSEDRLIPDILKAFQNNQTVTIRNPKATRPWQHVLEPLSGYLLLAQKLYEQPDEYTEAWNFGPLEDDVKPVDWILERMTENWVGANWQLDEGSHPHEAGLLKLDISKAKSKLQWQPVWYLENTLGKIIRWHQAWMKQEDMRQYCIQEIEQYVSDRDKASH